MAHNRIAVLVVEDEALVRMGIVDFLVDENFEVFEASNADEAIEILIAKPRITLLFTDVDMPGGMDGLKLAAAVRDRWPPIRIVVTSGHRRVTFGELPDRAIFIPKPYNPDEIVSTLRRIAGN